MSHYEHGHFSPFWSSVTMINFRHFYQNVLFVCISGGPVTYDEILAAARQQQFDKVQEL